MMEFRFFEIYRSVEYLELLMEGILVSAGLTLFAGVLGFILAFILAAFIYWRVVLLNVICIKFINVFISCKEDKGTKAIMPRIIFLMLPSRPRDENHPSFNGFDRSASSLPTDSTFLILLPLHNIRRN